MFEYLSKYPLLLVGGGGGGGGRGGRGARERAMVYPTFQQHIEGQNI